ncbi:MAG: hypothetical protein U0166_14750 [Acidobacteriota bacterium]
MEAAKPAFHLTELDLVDGTVGAEHVDLGSARPFFLFGSETTWRAWRPVPRRTPARSMLGATPGPAGASWQ